MGAGPGGRAAEGRYGRGAKDHRAARGLEGTHESGLCRSREALRLSAATATRQGIPRPEAAARFAGQPEAGSRVSGRQDGKDHERHERPGERGLLRADQAVRSAAQGKEEARRLQRRRDQAAREAGAGHQGSGSALSMKLVPAALALAVAALPASTLSVWTGTRWEEWWRSSEAPAVWTEPAPALAERVDWRPAGGRGGGGVVGGKCGWWGGGEASGTRFVAERFAPRRVRSRGDTDRSGRPQVG